MSVHINTPTELRRHCLAYFIPDVTEEALVYFLFVSNGTISGKKNSQVSTAVW